MYRRLAINLCLAVLLAWKVWYDDGSGLRFYHSATSQWDAIPDKPGVQVVLVCEDKEWKPGHPYRVIYRGSDWYWFDENAVHRSEGDGAPNGKWTDPPHRDARPGLTIADDVFESYIEAAQEDSRCAVP